MSFDENDAVYQKVIGDKFRKSPTHRTVEIVFSNPSAADAGEYVCSIKNTERPEASFESKTATVASTCKLWLYRYLETMKLS